MNRVRSGVYPNSISEVIIFSQSVCRQDLAGMTAMTGWRSSEGYTQTAMQAAADAMAFGVNPIETVCILEMEIMEVQIEIISSIKN